jgi:hypothetical protein
MCQGGTNEEKEEHFYLKETEKIQQQLMKDISIETCNHKTLLEHLDGRIVGCSTRQIHLKCTVWKYFHFMYHNRHFVKRWPPPVDSFRYCS